ncbi:peptidylprolyl cis-trans isomerase, FKBP-type domain containing protein [Acanthamoeba castellanii str. Neff]|uniref:peptidylprolyl isomerase n=1 Tax=Acanthamoeba castellanii (strain ATCC 30010 / Neff) TaxID=1257118 RepID=L8H0H0_ACACF|nr:peptidylprolyl cis-trans isomerase, FKBP-type domain containing protein [Acanthamoeba castellanii str. Neff]ELR18263.1 peptidylprolyl cis-trans isomerase, FKBP-type domain containing protein [Acanthamoeba castellanii str. Neff]
MEALSKAVDTLSAQLQEKDTLLRSLQSQLAAKEGYISQLHQVIVSTGGKAPAAPAASPAATDAAPALSKNQLKKQKRQQKQEETPATPVTPLKEQPAPAKEAVPATTPTTPESAKNKRKREATKGAEAKSTPTTPTKESAASPAKKKETPKKEAVTKKAETPAKSPAKDSKNVKVLKGGLKLEDTKLGAGKVATLGKRVSVLYKGFLTNGKSFDSSLNKPFTFRLGVGEVIKGWDAGVAGMKVGGRRKLVIPPALGYGRQSMPGIPGNSTLLFEVELVDVK